MAKALFFGLLAAVIVAVANILIPYLQSGIFLWRGPLRRSLLTGLGVGASIYIAMKAFEIITSPASPASSRNTGSRAGNLNYADEKISTEEMDEETVEGEQSAQDAEEEVESRAVSPEEEPSVAPGNKKQEKSVPAGGDEESIESEEASEIADLISETIDEE